jgi:predicted ATPase/DNA-binding SARP family transcriptional activator
MVTEGQRQTRLQQDWARRMGHVTISLLGTVQILRDGRPVSNQVYAKVVGLLAYLSVEADRPHTRAFLAGLFWPEQSDERARHSLRQALSTLRRVLDDQAVAGSYLLAVRDSVQFNRDASYDLDVHQLLELIAACARHNHRLLESCPACMTRLQQAIDLHRGEFLNGFTIGDSPDFEEWVHVWRERLRHHVIKALRATAQYHEIQEALAAACDALLRLLELDPWDEATHRKVMELQWRQGNRSEALAQYQTCRRLLEDELGVEPDEETVALFEAITSSATRPELTTPRVAAQPNAPRIPNPPNHLVGRERELEEIADLLSQQDCRLLTLLGPGGIGKTRLAIEVALNRARQAPGSVCFVALAEVADATGIVQAIAGALGLRLSNKADPALQLLEWLRDRSLFLVLDNVEHLIDDMALVARIIASAENVTILSTSRERLQLQGEWVFELNGLGFPASMDTDSFEAYGSVELLGQRLRQVRPRTPLRHEERPAVMRICQLVEGMPLALELAAGWAQTLSLEAIEGELSRNLDFLSSPLRDMPNRHRSMRAVFNQTWHMLTGDEQAAYRSLSVFQDGFRLAAAEAVTGLTATQLATLVSKSLVNQQTGGRYRLHSLLRQFVVEMEQPDDADMVWLRDRHAAYYLAPLAEREDTLTQPEQQAALAEIEEDLKNILAAWERAVTQGNTALIEKAVHALWLFFVMRGQMREGAAVFGEALATVNREDRTYLRASLLARYGGFLSGLGRYDDGIESLLQGLAIFRELDAPSDLGLTLNMLAAAWQMKGNHAESERCLEESLVQFRCANNEWGIAHSLNDLGLNRHLAGDNDNARVFCARSRVMFRRIGDRRGNAFAAYNLGMITSAEKDHIRARRLFRESLVLGQESGDQWGIAASFVQLGRESYHLADRDEARSDFLRALRIAWNSSVSPVVLDALAGISMLYLDEGDFARADEILTAVAAHPALTGQSRILIAELWGRPVSDLSGTESHDRWAVQAVNDLVRTLLA